MEWRHVYLAINNTVSGAFFSMYLIIILIYLFWRLSYVTVPMSPFPSEINKPFAEYCNDWKREFWKLDFSEIRYFIYKGLKQRSKLQYISSAYRSLRESGRARTRRTICVLALWLSTHPHIALTSLFSLNRSIVSCGVCEQARITEFSIIMRALWLQLIQVGSQRQHGANDSSA